MPAHLPPDSQLHIAVLTAHRPQPWLAGHPLLPGAGRGPCLPSWLGSAGGPATLGEPETGSEYQPAGLGRPLTPLGLCLALPGERALSLLVPLCWDLGTPDAQALVRVTSQPKLWCGSNLWSEEEVRSSQTNPWLPTLWEALKQGQERTGPGGPSLRVADATNLYHHTWPGMVAEISKQ